MSEEDRYYEQFRGDEPTYFQAVSLLDPIYYSGQWTKVMVVWGLGPDDYLNLATFVKKEKPDG